MLQREPNRARRGRHRGRIETGASIPGGYRGWVPFPRTQRLPGCQAAASSAVPIPLGRRASSSPASMSIDSPVQVACARAATKPGAGRSPDTLCAGVTALRHYGKAARRTTHNSSPALKENAPLGPPTTPAGTLHVAGFWRCDNLSPRADSLVSMYRRKNWGKQVFTPASAEPTKGSARSSFSLNADPNIQLGNASSAPQQSQMLVLGALAACTAAKPTC